MTNIPHDFSHGLICEDEYRDIKVPKRFSDRVLSHVVSNYLNTNYYFKPPLYLAIQGTPGEGKTTQAIAACTQRGILVKYLSSSELSGELESASKEKMKSFYNEAKSIRSLGNIVCIVLDDFHLGNSIVTDTDGKTTVNADLLVSYMMNLVESSFEDHIPIILTGNDFTRTYKALLRDGRADVFNWTPDFNEKVDIVSRLYAPILEPKDLRKIDEFVKAYSNRSIAFFVQIRNDLRRNNLINEIDKHQTINQHTLSLINSSLNNSIPQPDIKTLYKYAEERIASRKKGGLT